MADAPEVAITSGAARSETPKAGVFISYSRKDLSFADHLEAALKARRRPFI